MFSRLNRTLQAPAFLILGLLLLQGCVYHYVIPEDLDRRVDRAVTFASLKSAPEKHRGQLVALGGAILEARNLKEGTQIEVLELPLDRYDRPVGPVSDSQGRFLVLHPGYLETAVLQKGRRITVVGEMSGTKLQKIDEVEYTYPFLKAEFIHVWSQVREQDYYYAAYPYPYPYPYWYGYDPWWPSWRSPWGPPVIIIPDDSSPPKKRRFNPSQKSSGSSFKKGVRRSFTKTD